MASETGVQLHDVRTFIAKTREFLDHFRLLYWGIEWMQSLSVQPKPSESLVLNSISLEAHAVRKFLFSPNYRNCLETALWREVLDRAAMSARPFFYAGAWHASALSAVTCEVNFTLSVLGGVAAAFAPIQGKHPTPRDVVLKIINRGRAVMQLESAGQIISPERVAAAEVDLPPFQPEPPILKSAMEAVFFRGKHTLFAEAVRGHFFKVAHNSLGPHGPSTGNEWYLFKEILGPKYSVESSRLSVEVERELLIILSENAPDLGKLELGNDARHARGAKIDKHELNVKARTILRSRPAITSRDLAKEIGCALGRVSELPAWQAVMEQRRKGRRPISKEVSLSPALEKIIGTADDPLEKLIRDQRADAEPSPLDDDGGHSGGAPRRANVYRKR